MSLLHALVARGNVVLAEHDAANSGNKYAQGELRCWRRDQHWLSFPSNDLPLLRLASCSMLFVTLFHVHYCVQQLKRSCPRYRPMIPS